MDGSGATNDEVPVALLARLHELKEQHQDLDAAIAAVQTSANPDQLLVARLKKRKLALRDAIVALENSLMPDIIA